MVISNRGTQDAGVGHCQRATVSSLFAAALKNARNGGFRGTQGDVACCCQRRVEAHNCTQCDMRVGARTELKSRVRASERELLYITAYFECWCLYWRMFGRSLLLAGSVCCSHCFLSHTLHIFNRANKPSTSDMRLLHTTTTSPHTTQRSTLSSPPVRLTRPCESQRINITSNASCCCRLSTT